MNSNHISRRLRYAGKAVTLTGMAFAFAVVCGAAAAPTASAQDEAYHGTATVTLGVNNYCDLSSSSPQRAATKTFTKPVTATVAAPQTNGAGEQESNPVHLTVTSDDQAGEGGFSMSTAQSFATSSGSAGLQYWTLQRSGDRIEGTLSDPHTSEAAAFNLISVAQDLVPCQPQMGTIPMVAAMGQGSALSGDLGADSGSFQIVGRSADGLYDFQIDIDLSAG